MSIFQQIGQFFARWLAQLEATFIESSVISCWWTG